MNTKVVFNSPKNFAWYANSSWVFTMAILLIIGGSVSTGLYFAAGCISLLILLPSWKDLQKPPTLVMHSLITPVILWSVILVTGLIANNPQEILINIGSNLQLLFLFILTLRLLQTPEIDYLTLFSRGARIALPLAFLTGVLQRTMFSPPTLTGSMGNTLVYASISFVFSWVALIGIHRENILWRILAVLAFTCGMGIIFLSLRKVAIIGIPIFGLAALMYLHHNRFLSWSKFIGILLIGILLAGSAVVAAGYKGVFLERRITQSIERFEEHGLTIEGFFDDKRLILAKYGIQVFFENPITGVGTQNVVQIVRKKAHEDNVRIRNYSHLHNDYLDTLVGTGIFGLAFYLGMLLLPMIVALKSRKDDRYSDRLFFAFAICGGNALLAITNILTGQDLMLSAFTMSIIVLMVSCVQAENNSQLRTQLTP